MPLPAQTVHFGPFQLDLRAAELHHNGTKIKLPEQPFQILCELVEHPGEVVTREELRQRLWHSDTFVDFEHGLNTAVKRLRELLGDSAEDPRYIETLPRHGYRLMVPVERAEPVVPEISKVAARRWKIWLVVSVAMVAAVVAGLLWRQRLLERFHPVKIESLAVLPLENLSGNPEEEYFADGMTEALITELGKVHALRVISKQSVMHFKGTTKTVPQIAEELNVDALVEGSALRDGTKVRITVQLLRAQPEEHLWARSYEREMPDILTLQSEAAHAIANEIKAQVTSEESMYLTKVRTVNPAAYDAHLKGWYELRKGTPEGMENAIRYFRKAIELGPDYALPHDGLAWAYLSLPYFTSISPTEAMLKGEAEATKALELDESLGEAHVDLAWARAAYHWDWSGAEVEFRRALQLNPGSASIHRMYGWFLAWHGRHDEALAEARYSLERDPLSPAAFRTLGIILFCNRQYDEALHNWNEATKIDPNNVLVIADLGRAYVQKRMFKEAIAQFEKARALAGGETGGSATGGGYLGHAYALAGRKNQALKILDGLRQRSKRSYVSPLNIAMIYVGLGDKEQALEWLQKGYDAHDGDMVLLKVSPIWDPVRSDPRFQDLVRRMNFPP